MAIGRRLRQWFGKKSSSPGTESPTASTSSPGIVVVNGTSTNASSPAAAGRDRRPRVSTTAATRNSESSTTRATSTRTQSNRPTTSTRINADGATVTTVRNGDGTSTVTTVNVDGTTTTTTRRRRRRRRRSESPVGLPLYSEELGDDEMSLFKGADISRLDLNNDEGEEDGDPASSPDLTRGNGEGEEELDDADDDAGSDIQAGAPLGTRMTTASSMISFDQIGRGRSASDAPSMAYSLAGTTSPVGFSPISPMPLPISSGPGTPPGANRPAVRQTSRSSLLIPTSSSPVTNRQRSSTLRSLFTRRNDSTSALSSSPTGSAGATGRSPYGQGPGFSSSSVTRLASGSTSSIRSTASISAPLQHTLVSSSFVFPRSGPTASQIAFISSRDALGAYGYGAGAVMAPSIDDHAATDPPQFDASAISTTNLSGLEPPPSVFREENLSPAPSPSPPLASTGLGSGTSAPLLTTRGGRSSSVSSQMSSSPLARVHTHGDDEEEDDQEGRGVEPSASINQDELGSTRGMRPAFTRLPTVPSTPLDEHTAFVTQADLNPEATQSSPAVTIAELAPTLESTVAEGMMESPPSTGLKINTLTPAPPLILLHAGTPTSPLFPRSPGGTVVIDPTTATPASSTSLA